MRIQIFSLLTVSWLALTFTFAQEGATKKAAVQESLVTTEGDYVLNDFLRRPSTDRLWQISSPNFQRLTSGGKRIHWRRRPFMG